MHSLRLVTRIVSGVSKSKDGCFLAELLLFSQDHIPPSRGMVLPARASNSRRQTPYGYVGLWGKADLGKITV